MDPCSPLEELPSGRLSALTALEWLASLRHSMAPLDLAVCRGPVAVVAVVAVWLCGVVA